MEHLITFETAKLAKEKGFAEPTDTRYWTEPCAKWAFSKKGAVQCDNSSESSISVPSQSLLQKWLREKHNLHTEVTMRSSESEIFFRERVWLKPVPGKNCSNISTGERLATYEEALEIGLFEALNRIY
jgi:hypothetical protein